MLSRELVYTGLTRARQVLHVAGSADVLQAAPGMQFLRGQRLPAWRQRAAVAFHLAPQRPRPPQPQ